MKDVLADNSLVNMLSLSSTRSRVIKLVQSGEELRIYIPANLFVTLLVFIGKPVVLLPCYGIKFNGPCLAVRRELSSCIKNICLHYGRDLTVRVNVRQKPLFVEMKIRKPKQNYHVHILKDTIERNLILNILEQK